MTGTVIIICISLMANNRIYSCVATLLYNCKAQKILQDLIKINKSFRVIHEETEAQVSKVI